MGINLAGVVIWESLNGENSPQEIVEILQAHFSEVPDTAEDDVVEFVDELEKREFVGYEVEVTSA